MASLLVRSRSAALVTMAMLCGAFAAPACGSGDAPSAVDLEHTGTIGLDLQVGQNVLLDSVSYDISGNGFHTSGSLNVANSTKISALIAGIPAGKGFTIALAAADVSDANTTCSGSASFDVSAGATTPVSVHLLCKLARRTGSVLVNGSLNVCPTIDSLTLEAETTVGHTLAFSASASDSDQAPQALSYSWTSTGGTIAGATTPKATFTCTTAGQFGVTLTVSDGDCSDTATATVTCSPSAGGTGGAGGSGGAGGAANTGGAAGSGGGAGLTFATWPGGNQVAIADNMAFGGNMSGLGYEPASGSTPPRLWAIQNSPSKLWRLQASGALFVPSADDWASGKLLHYPDGGGAPDSEGVVKPDVASPFAYVSTERDNNANTISRLSVLRFDTSAAGSSLTAVNEWNVTRDLPVAGPNLGLEAVSYVPDAYLVSKGFVDESTGQAYDPSRYANHGGGIFFVGLEANGVIYGYAFDHIGGGFQRVATIASGHISIMDLSFDREVGYLWTYCDNTCGNHATLLDVDTRAGSPTRGHFTIIAAFNHPTTLPDANNEGIAFATEAECVGGQKSFFWTDDGETDGHALRRDTIPCGRFLGR